MDTHQRPEREEVYSEFQELIYQYGLKIYNMNCLEDNLTNLRIELAEIEEKLKGYGRND